ncbi:MAG: AAA family ATPase [Acidimicrobiia bacterium]
MVTADTGAALDVSAPQAVAEEIVSNVSRVVRGRPEAVQLATVALLSGGHLLVEDVPGHGKTLLAKALARSIGGSYKRIQGTPDLLPSEITGVSVFHKGSEEWEFRAGPLFANVVLADEINRATPRSQAALLEAMEERQVTVDGICHPLPDPFFLVATQNPFDHAGTFPLVEGQRDRFALVLEMGHLGRHAERELLLGVGGADHLHELGAVTSAEQLRSTIARVAEVHCAPAIADYIVDLGEASRSHPDVRLGASPRASLALLHSAKALAVLHGRGFITPDDVKSLVVPVLAHRLVLSGGPDIHAATTILRAIVERVAVPRG